MKKRSGMAYFLYNGTILFETCFFVYYIERNVAAESKQASKLCANLFNSKWQQGPALLLFLCNRFMLNLIVKKMARQKWKEGETAKLTF